MDEEQVAQVVSNTETGSVAKEYTGRPERDINRLYLLMAAVIIVLLVGYAATFMAVGSSMTTSNAEKQATYQSLRDQVKAQNDKIEVLTDRTNELNKIIQDQTKVMQDVQKAVQETN